MLQKIKTNKENIIIFILLLIGIFLRIFLFGKVPAGHNQDESMASINAQSILYTGKDIYGNSYPPILEAWGIAPMNALMTYLMIPFIYLFGASLFVIRLPILIVSLISLPCMYSIGKELKDKKLGIILLFLTAISPWHIIQSRWALEANMFPHMLLFGFYFLIKLKKNKINVYFSMIFFALSMYCYGISYYTVPFILIISSIILFKNKLVNIKDILLCIFVYILISFPIILTILNNMFNWGDFKIFNITIPYLANNHRVSDILFYSDNPFMQFIINLEFTLYISLLQFFDSYNNSIPYFGRTYIISSIFLIIGIILYNKRSFEIKNYKSKLISIWFIFAIISGLITNHVNTNRINMIFYPIIIFTGYGIYFVLQKSKEIFKFTIFIYILHLLLFSLFYYGDYYKSDRISFFDLDECIYYMEDNLSGETIYIGGMFLADNKGFINTSETIQKDVLEYYKPNFKTNNTYIYTEVNEEFIKESNNCYIVVLKTVDLKIDLDEYDCINFDRFALIKK